ncbi:hypothetical protein CVU75_01770 [Candidatus Dependentiae bacterium HGW-Dependentiae-1]|nr:MAG: hypothetical protein CVU75_01770 [Candidatus Dependentiae bacterium HGW-Dependentiae-1]
MIPLKLHIRNFLSYGPDTQTISFSPYRLLCLSGRNGHGKSALLDAITWAVWGQARKVSGATKADVGLMRLGQTHMLVSLDFLFNGQQYRTKRELSLLPNNKQLVNLDFGIWDEATAAFKPLTGKTLRETQERIEQTLNLDFDSFVNSAFLRQGQSNEFSKKSPKERKEILAAILGLNKYDPVRALAFEKIRQATTQKAQLAALQEKRTNELAQATMIPQELATIMLALEQQAQHEQTLAQEKTIHELNKKQYAEQQKEAQFLQFQLVQKNKNAAEIKEKVSFIANEWRTIHKKMLNAPNAHALETEKKQVSHALHEEQQKLHKQLELKQSYLQHKEKLQQMAQHLQETQAAAHTKQKVQVERIYLELQATRTVLTQGTQQQALTIREKERLALQISQINRELERHKKAVANNEALTRQFEKRKEHYQKYIAQGNLLKTEQTNLSQKKSLAHDETNPSCPLCEQNLSAARKRFLKQKFDEQEQFLAYRLGKLSTLIQKLKTVLITQHETLKEAQKTAETIAALQANLEQQVLATQKLTEATTLLEKQLHDTGLREKELTRHYEQEKSTLAQVEKEGQSLLLKNNEYTSLMQTATRVEKQMADAAYDEKKYLALSMQLQKLEQRILEYEAIQKELTLQEQRKQEVSQLITGLKKIKQEVGDLNSKLAPFSDLSLKEKLLVQKEQELGERLAALGAQKEELVHKKGSLESQQLAFEKLKKEEIEHKKLLAQTEECIGDYQAIAQAISKDGIQALLIEEAIPEIEQAANDILGRLTNNQAHISIESLKDLKKGGTRETLDINISDTAGIRAYELFSGGEAFRIDFALRIAISKLLARRAGTSLQTLIIDEGFGSQDEEGLTNIMNAIYAIQEDFSKIIIVSHLNSMKDQFPVHMIVEKGANGSKVSVLEQG